MWRPMTSYIKKSPKEQSLTTSIQSMISILVSPEYIIDSKIAGDVLVFPYYILKEIGDIVVCKTSTWILS